MKLLATGCSFSLEWPNLQFPGYTVQNEAQDGAGLGRIYQKLSKMDLAKFDVVIVQLPTPIRSFVDNTWQCKTHQLFVDFCKSFEGVGVRVAERMILRRYVSECVRISRLHPTLAFLVVNCCGYPFLHPHRFGGDPQNTMVARIHKQTGCDVVVADMQGKPGFAKVVNEQSEIQYPPKWNVVHPPGEYVVDAHPNRLACEYVASIVYDWLRCNVMDRKTA